MPTNSLVTSIDIINLSHSLKDICEVGCKSTDCMNAALKTLLQYNLIKLNLIFSDQLDCIAAAQRCCPPDDTPDCPKAADRLEKDEKDILLEKAIVPRVDRR